MAARLGTNREQYRHSNHRTRLVFLAPRKSRDKGKRAVRRLAVESLEPRIVFNAETIVADVPFAQDYDPFAQDYDWTRSEASRPYEQSSDFAETVPSCSSRFTTTSTKTTTVWPW